MAFCEGQLSCSAAKGHFSSGLVMAKTAGEKHARVGEFAEGLDAGKWWKLKILDSKDGKFYVTWIGWEKKFDRWIDAKDIRPFTPQVYPAGTECNVEWNGEHFKAKVIQNKLGLHLVHYDGYPDIDDEWVALNRIEIKK